MWDILSWLLFVVFIAGLVVVGGLLLRGYLNTGSPAGALTGGFFAPKPEKRLDVVDQASVDGRRRLVLIRRDGVEHLIMTGGPVDVVIETGIKQTAAVDSAKSITKREDGEAGGTVIARPTRTFGKAVGE